MTDKQETLAIARQAGFEVKTRNDDSTVRDGVWLADESELEAFRTLCEAPLLARIAELETELSHMTMAATAEAERVNELQAEKDAALPLVQDGAAIQRWYSRGYISGRKKGREDTTAALATPAAPIAQDGAAVPVATIRQTSVRGPKRFALSWAEEFTPADGVRLFAAPAAPVAERDGWKPLTEAKITYLANKFIPETNAQATLYFVRAIESEISSLEGDQ